MTLTRTKPRIGDEAWFVEWCFELVFYEDSTDVDRDRCKMRTRRFATKEEAVTFARAIYPVTKNTFGVVEYWHAIFTAYEEDDVILYPHVGYWEPDEDSEFYEGEDDGT